MGQVVSGECYKNARVDAGFVEIDSEPVCKQYTELNHLHAFKNTVLKHAIEQGHLDRTEALTVRNKLHQLEIDLVHNTEILNKLWEKQVMLTSGLQATELQKFAEHVLTSPVGSVFIVPTDTVYCLICKALDSMGIHTLYNVKNRAPEKPVSLWIPSQQYLNEDNFHPVIWKFMKALWPAPVAVVLNKGPWLDEILPDWATSRVGSQGKGRGNSIALRIPDSTIDIALMDKIGPMVVTSANPSGGIDVFDWMESAFDMATEHEEVRGILTGGFAPSFNNHSGESPASTVVSLVDFKETAENLMEPNLPKGFKIGSELMKHDADLEVLRNGVVDAKKLQTMWRQMKEDFSASVRHANIHPSLLLGRHVVHPDKSMDSVKEPVVRRAIARAMTRNVA